ncbi:MAG TPA: cytochrome c oxidase subunit II [Streptosporangiaceae bacterium]|jgi:cytochrome c oxidase subunit 2
MAENPAASGPGAGSPAAADGAREPRHALRLLLMWIPLSVAAILVIWFVWYPHLPPGDMSDAASGQQFDIAVLAVTAAPVVIGVLLYFVYAIVVWRARPGDDSDGPPVYGHTRIQAWWIVVTSMIVLWAFAFGTYQLITPGGAGGGEGPAPIWKLAGTQTANWSPGTNDMLQVQVIGQQWVWSYRYPQFGGMESTTLELPDNMPVEFHVTSLDVVHSFWAYLLGVKADANPQVDNVAYATPKQLGKFVVRCNELCGIWHGAMFNSGKVITPAAFQTWATGVQNKERSSGLLAALPPYALTYDPTVVPQLGKDVVKVAGITGANGYYYPGVQAGTTHGDPVSP